MALWSTRPSHGLERQQRKPHCLSSSVFALPLPHKGSPHHTPTLPVSRSQQGENRPHQTLGKTPPVASQTSGKLHSFPSLCLPVLGLLRPIPRPKGALPCLPPQTPELPFGAALSCACFLGAVCWPCMWV